MGPDGPGGVAEGAPDPVEDRVGQLPPPLCEVMVHIRAVNRMWGTEAVAGGCVGSGGSVVRFADCKESAVDECLDASACGGVADVEPERHVAPGNRPVVSAVAVVETVRDDCVGRSHKCGVIPGRDFGEDCTDQVVTRRVMGPVGSSGGFDRFPMRAPTVVAGGEFHERGAGAIPG